MKQHETFKSSLKRTSNGLQCRYPWEFKRYFKTNAYSWRGSQLASKRLTEALKELKKCVKQGELLVVAEGAIYLMSRFWPAFQSIDTSSGQLGGAVYHAMTQLLPFIIEAPAPLSLRQQWLDIMWEILSNDGVSYTAQIAEHWGELAVFQEEASRRADNFAALVKNAWQEGHSPAYFDAAYLSALLYAERYDEIFTALELEPHSCWYTRQYGARALAVTDPDAAIAYAEDTRHLINAPQLSISIFCEDILLSHARMTEAYERYGIMANEGNTYLNWFNKIKKKYSQIRTDEEILADLIQSNVAEPGKWFATANKLNAFDVALALIEQHPADPKTLNRASNNRSDEYPDYAMKVALCALKWMAQGYGYEISTLDVHTSLSLINKTAIRLKQWSSAASIVRQIAMSSASHDFYKQTILQYLETTN